MRTRNNQVKIYLSDDELKTLKKKIDKSELSQSDFIRDTLLEKRIVVFKDTQVFITELKRIGNNINQLTRAVNMGQINCENEVEVLSREVNKLWQSLKSLKGDVV